MTLMTFQPAPRKTASSSWMIFPLPRTGPSRRCRLQFTTKIRLSSFSRAASEIAPSDSGSSISPSPRKAHTCRSSCRRARGVQVLEEAGLVDRHQRAEAHRHGGELPVVGHQPRVRVRRQPLAAHLLAELEQLLLADASLEERPGVDPRRHVPLHEQQVAAVPVAGGVPEVVEAGVVQRGRRLEADAMCPPSSEDSLFARNTSPPRSSGSSTGSGAPAPGPPGTAAARRPGWC